MTSYDPAATSKLQFAVGMATLSFYKTPSLIATVYGLNTVETLRQSNGLSGTLYNVPMIIGPTSFYVFISTETGGEFPSGWAGDDLGTNHITWGTLNETDWTGEPRGPKASTTGAFGYGLCPCNSDSGPINGFTPLFQAFNLPIYGAQGASPQELWYGGPPAFAAEGPSVRALGWLGYSLGFTDFAVAPVIGTYHLYAAVPPAYNTPQNPTPSPGPNGTPTPAPGILAAGAQLTSLTPLPAFSNPTLKPDLKGGGTITMNVPAGATEGLVEVVSVEGSGKMDSPCVTARGNMNAYYTLVAYGSGTHAVVLADNLGPLTQSGQPTPSICPQGEYYLYAVGADYPLYEASYPDNLSQLPLIKGPSGRADVTTSAFAVASYPDFPSNQTSGKR